MQVLSDFIRNELSEDQLLPILRQLLPLLLTVLSPQGTADQHSALTRARAVAIFRQCMTALDMVRKEHPDAVSEAVSTVLPQWLATFHAILSIPPSTDVADPNNWDAIAIRIQIFRTLDVLQTSFSMTPEVTEGFCNIIVKNLNDLMPAFRTYYLLGGENSDKGGLEPPTPVSADDPDINLSLMHLACPAMDFLGEVVRKSVRKTKVAADWVAANIGTVMSLTLYWAQIPVEDVRTIISSL
jgi:importin-9